MALHAERGGGEMVRRPVATVSTRAGETLATLFSDAPVAAWLTPSRAWWPRPRRVAAIDATARWATGCCPVCRCYSAALIAVGVIEGAMQ